MRNAEVFENIKTWMWQGSQHPAEYLTDLDFADHIALVSETITNAQVLQKPEAAAAAVGLTINQRWKRRSLATYPQENILHSRAGNIEMVCDLLSRLRSTRVKQRHQCSQSSCLDSSYKLWRIWKVPQLNRERKPCVFRTTVEAILLYGSQCWTLTAAQHVHLMGPISICSAKLSTSLTEMLSCTDPCHPSALHSAPDDCSSVCGV